MRAASNGPGFEKIISLSKCVNEKELVLQLKKVVLQSSTTVL